MGPRKANPQSQGDVSRLHPFHEFPDDLPSEIFNNYTKNLGWIYNLEFAISPNIDCKKMNEIGILERLNPYLMKMFMQNGVKFTCNDWKILFSIKEPVFKELCVEFFSMVSFEANTIDPQYTNALVFFVLVDSIEIVVWLN